ncbi:hypothetical protein AAHA92_31665 [Salvia divinorum]|uniref:Uncharacterized protein n=1 Tax=Salvia divinorum TaxID=28513 RepID=A0ABD1FI66_SALDI
MEGATHKKMKVKRGCVAIKVGLEEGEFQRFTIPISYLSHPFFKRFLEKAHEAYGYNDVGPLKLPCSVEDFHHLRWQIEKESNGYRHHFHQHHHLYHHAGALSFKSC